ncbi:sushi, von Willebrand factor type A, EGF and pentraxin domain-containing protein 1-like [Halichondria panicea]|uniref:sushi, von Willebrand factor type A, EGF and pentraxin domain-containing protein 1-like n=1 Tax=Halichondria panicea TaxID=6063 RepID=UPI00312B4830
MVQGICYFTILSTTYTVVDCGDPPTVPNGSPGTPTSTAFGGTVFYMCNSNRYHMSGSATVTCEASGSWSTRPTCSAICNDQQIENGNIIYNHDTTPRSEGAIAVYSCMSGYQLSGVSTRICVDSHRGMGGAWTGSIPSCIAICDSITLAHGVISYSPSTTPILEGGVAIHSCGEGYGLSPSVRAKTCQPDRTWSGEDITCQRIMCAALPNVTNWTIDYSSGTTAPYDYGTTATYQCNYGHMLTSGGDRVRTCTGDGSSRSGRWNGTAPQCPPVDCGAPPSITNGSRGIPTTTTFTGTVTYSCVTGYWISPGVTTATATCMANRTWGPLPTCQLLDCGSPPTVPNASPGTPTRTTYQGTVTYTCDSRYKVSNGVTKATATCQDNGNWRPLPTCTIVDCGLPPTIINGSPGTPTSTTFEGTVSYTCNNRYRMSGSATVTCEASGSWSTRPTCSDIVCPPLPTITNGIISYSPDVTPDYDLGTNATYTCEAGFYLEGNEVRVCMDDDGMWSGREPSCVPIECPPLLTVTNGVITYAPGNTPAYGLGIVATYACDAGFVLDLSLGGSEMRTCVDNGLDAIGIFDRLAPICAPIECPSLPDITNGMVSYESDNMDSLALGAVATYSCTAGFFLDVSEGDEFRACLDNDGMGTIGVWSGQEPSCVSVPPPVRSVLFQLRLTNINNCPDWVDQDGRIEAVMSEFATEVESHCGCGFLSVVITAPLFRCFPGSDKAVTFRATLTDSRLLTPIQDWIQTNGFIPIQNVLIEVDKSCPVQVSSLADTECTNQPTAAGGSDIAAVVGGVVGGVVGVVIVLIIVVGIVVIVIAVLVFKSRREKLTVNKTTKPDLPPVSLKGVVNTGEIQLYEMMEMGHEYEEVSKFQRAIGGEYEIIGAPSQTTGSESKTLIKTEPSPPTPPTPQPSQATKPARNDTEFTECIAYSMTTHSRPPQPTGL